MNHYRMVFVTTFFYCVVACLLAGAAHGGTYSVFACQFPDGRVAPTTGWHVPNPDHGVRYDLSCHDGSGMLVETIGTRSYPPGYFTGFDIRAPADLRFVGARAKPSLYSTGDHNGNWMWGVGAWGQLPAEPGWRGVLHCGGNVGICLSDRHFEHVFVSDGTFPAFEALRWGIECYRTRSECPAASRAASGFASLHLIVEDAFRPVLRTPLSGSLADPNATTPVRDLHFSVEDRGGGLRSATLEINGVAVQTVSFGNSTDPCVPPYGDLTPCPSEAQGSFSFDTTSLPPGEHSGRLLIHDASNAAPLAHEFHFIGLGAPGTGHQFICSSRTGFEASGPTRPVPYGKRVNVSFRLPSTVGLPPTLRVLRGDTSVKPIAKARLRRGRYWTVVRVRRAGTVRLGFPLSSQAVVFRCSTPSWLSVRAGAELSLRPRSLNNGETLHFRGRVLGGRTAARRAVLIQARARGGSRKWTPVRVLRTDDRGRFRMRYTFRRTTQRVRFEFRAVVRAERGFPYAKGWSRRRSVLVRG
jgi:hypothetical protein